MVSDRDEFVFEAKTKFGYTIRLKRDTWNYKITVFHGEMFRREDDVRLTIEEPVEIHYNRQKGRSNFVFWRLFEGTNPWDRYLKVTAAIDENARTGIVTTALPTSHISTPFTQEGGRKLWPTSER